MVQECEKVKVELHDRRDVRDPRDGTGGGIMTKAVRGKRQVQFYRIYSSKYFNIYSYKANRIFQILSSSCTCITLRTLRTFNDQLDPNFPPPRPFHKNAP